MTQTFLLTNAADAPAAVATGLPCGFLCYRITRTGVLQRTLLPRTTRGGLLGLTDAPALPPSRLPELQQALSAECHRRGYRGIIADLPPASAQSLLPALSALCRQGYAVFLPPEAARNLPESRVLLPGSLSGGTLESMLESYAEAWGKHRLCLDLQRCHHRFPMPSFDPQGQPLSRPELQQLLDTHHPKVFFSTAPAPNTSPCTIQKPAGILCSSTMLPRQENACSVRRNGALPPAFCCIPNGAAMSAPLCGNKNDPAAGKVIFSVSIPDFSLEAARPAR